MEISNLVSFPISTPQGIIYLFPLKLFYEGFVPFNAENQSTKMEQELLESCSKQQELYEVKQITKQKQVGQDQLNNKNITPNLARKLLVFLSSVRCKQLIHKLYPQIPKSQFNKIMAFINSMKNKKKIRYVGKQNLKKLWFRTGKSSRPPIFYQVLRRLSRYYLQNQCVTSILVSKRIKSSLKGLHLEKRRKFLTWIDALQS